MELSLTRPIGWKSFAFMSLSSGLRGLLIDIRSQGRKWPVLYNPIGVTNFEIFKPKVDKQADSLIQSTPVIKLH
jgi:hypothetical protein